MSELLKRLTRLTRTHLYDFLEHRWPGWRSDASWRGSHETRQHTKTTDDFPASSFKTRTQGGLPYDPELARYYAALDLPFGTPLEEVTKRWKAYLKKCHPDRYANEPEKQTDATRLTQELTEAHEKIKQAWKRHRS